MSVVVRPCRDLDEFGRAFMQIGQYFAMEGGAEAAERFSRVLPVERMLAAWDGDQVVGGTGALPFRLSVPGGAVACAGTTVVGVAPTHRRRGVLRAMMRAHLDQAHERGEPVAALWASEEGIYRRFGYGGAAFAGEVTIPREYVAFDAPIEQRGRARLVGRDEALVAFPQVLEAQARRRPGMILRTREWWEDRTLADPPGRRDGGGPKRFALLEHEGDPVAYAIYRHRFGYEEGSSTGAIVVVEAVAAGPEAAAGLWRFLLDIDWVATVHASLLPPDHPLFFLLQQPRRMKYRMGDGLWVRLVDVAAALAARTYPDGELVLEVRDELCLWNAGRWQIAGGEVSPTDAAGDVALDVSALGAAYLGGVSLACLAQGGHVDELRPGGLERADALLGHALHPWCPEIF
jgi:predicted acetyltransferase